MASIESIDMVRFKEEMKNVFFFFWALLKVSALKKKKKLPKQEQTILYRQKKLTLVVNKPIQHILFNWHTPNNNHEHRYSYQTSMVLRFDT